MTLEVATHTDALVGEVRCYAVVSPGQLCTVQPPPGQVYCRAHLAQATLDRQLAEAGLEQARTAVLTRAATVLDQMISTLVDIAHSTECEDADRIRAAAKVLEIGGLLGPKRSDGSVLQQVTVNVSQGNDGNVTDADHRLLDLMGRLGPEGAAKAASLRKAIETGLAPER